jgi:hypothetical protein
MADNSSISGLNGISGDLPQRKQDTAFFRKNAQKTRPPAPVDDDERSSATPLIGEATTQLIEALDRLRATNELTPGESELARTLRGVKYYQDESRTGLPIIPDSQGASQGAPVDQAREQTSDPPPDNAT